MSEDGSMSRIIRRLRTEKGWTQEELGERVGVSAQAVSKWETEQSLPDIAQLPLLAKAFGVTTDLLFGLEEEPAPDFPELDYLCTDPEEAWRQWREMGRKVEDCLDNYTCTSLYVLQGYLLCYPDSLVYHPEHAKEVLEELLTFAEAYAKKKPNDPAADYSMQACLTNLNALAGNEEKALATLRDAPELPHELSFFRRAEVYRLLGKRREEYFQLRSCFATLPNYLLTVAYRTAENALAQGRKEDALDCVRFGQGFLKLMFGEEKVDPLFNQNGNSFLQLGARALLAQGKRAEALAWLERMAEERLESLVPGYTLGANTPLFNAIQIAPPRGDEKSRRYLLAQLLHSLDHPDLAPLREEPKFQELRARVEAQMEEGAG